MGSIDMIALVDIVITVGMLVVVPMGLTLMDGPGLTRLRRLWPAGAALGSIALWLPRGATAGVLAGAYALFTAALALQAPWRIVRRRTAARSVPPAAGSGPPPGRSPLPRELAFLTALVTPAVAGTAMVAERSGFRLFGFRLETLRLTEAHFHFAGFAAALIAGLVCRAEGDSAPARAAALTVPGGTAVVFVGFFVGDWVQLAGAAILTAGMWLVGWLTWRDVRGAETDPVARGLLALSASVLAVTMLLALDWALGEATGLPHLPIAWMAATHGALNAFGFAFCGVLAWRRLRPAGPDSAIGGSHAAG
ncbi:YndJ family protein [Actinoallomurus sp. NPDC052274]|uniref:YndJ family protein n=1 Tax=Actinoallomurus sp. NPDC052274 TaxID=3155420 RepID=UPI00344411F3